jgi:hypothetical protein
MNQEPHSRISDVPPYKEESAELQSAFCPRPDSASAIG